MRLVSQLVLVLFLVVLLADFSEGWRRRRRRRRRKPRGPNRAACEATVDSYYRSILHRAPDGGGLNYWVGKCMQRMSVDTIKHNFYHSAERRSLCTRKIIEYYRKLLGREPDRGGLNYWVNRCAGGKQTLSSIAIGFQSSQEYIRAKCQRDIKSVFGDLVLREPKQGELKHHTDRCVKGSSIDSIRANLFNSNERKQVCIHEITKFYKVFLDRPPSKLELFIWVVFCSGGRLRLCHIMRGIEKQGAGRNGVSGSAKIFRVCEHTAPGGIRCEGGKAIHVITASYGRTAGQGICGGPVHTTNCKASSSLGKVRQSCEGKSSCSLHASNGVFGDPCRGTRKYLEVEYACARAQIFMLCEHRGSDRITCGSGTVIHVLWANYGRTVGGQTCPGAVYTTACRAGSSLSKVRQLCEKKTTCSLHASNNVFGDPCRGTVKYLEVHYTCD